MTIESSAFENGGMIPKEYTCDGDNMSPPLHISDVPSAAKMLVIIMDDPDVPRSIMPDGVYDHWLVWNIPPHIGEIHRGNSPGISGKNTGGSVGYTGPCPPDREHRYFFKLYALNIGELELSEDAAKADLEKAMTGHILEQAELMGRYNRK